MKYGMPTLVECKTLDECVKLAASLGLDFVEINTSFPEYVFGNFDTDRACELAESHGVFYTIHADEALNPFDFNPKVSKVYFEIMKDTIKIAKEIKAKAINLHLQKGIYVTLPEKVILLTEFHPKEDPRFRYLPPVPAYRLYTYRIYHLDAHLSADGHRPSTDVPGMAASLS